MRGVRVHDEHPVDADGQADRRAEDVPHEDEREEEAVQPEGRHHAQVGDDEAEHRVDECRELPSQRREQELGFGAGCDRAGGLASGQVEADGARTVVRIGDGLHPLAIEARRRVLGAVHEAPTKRTRRDQHAADPSRHSTELLVPTRPGRRRSAEAQPGQDLGEELVVAGVLHIDLAAEEHRRHFGIHADQTNLRPRGD